MRATEYKVIGEDPKTLTVRQLMQNAVMSVRPETSGLTIAEILTKQNFGSVPVVDLNQTLLGLVSEFDLLKALDEGKDLREVKAEDLMTRTVVTVTEDMGFTDLRVLFQRDLLIRVPVVRGKTLVGIVARRDLLYGYAKALAYYWL